MDGFDTALWVTENYPEVRVLALSMHDDEPTIVRMIKNGTRGYILKDSSPKELQQSINALMTKGFYYSERVTGRLIHSIRDWKIRKAKPRIFCNSVKEK
jgi:DNA-binding NarL/FixJ family response regulator